MRLIDADVLNKTIFEIGCHKTKINTMDIMDIIKEQPTAYDIEKVVAELEKLKNTGSVTKTEMLITKACVNKAINIVRKGGVE